mgnify:CR=1 FL=1
MSTPKNKDEAQKRIRELRLEYVKYRGKDHVKANRIAREIYALNEWLVANK